MSGAYKLADNRRTSPVEAHAAPVAMQAILAAFYYILSVNEYQIRFITRPFRIEFCLNKACYYIDLRLFKFGICILYFTSRVSEGTKSRRPQILE